MTKWPSQRHPRDAGHALPAGVGKKRRQPASWRREWGWNQYGDVALKKKGDHTIPVLRGFMAPSTRQEYNAHLNPTYSMRIRTIMKLAHSASEKASGKKATNISLAMDVYLDAKNFGINISQLCEQKLREEIQKRKEQQWNEQHANFLAAYNSVVETEGVALQEWRAF
jgi:antitoxin CcdA